MTKPHSKDAKVLAALTPTMCEHMAAMIDVRNYERDPATGKLKVKTCLAPREDTLRHICGHTSPIGAKACYSCGGTEFNEDPQGIIELETCHYRCKRCRNVTAGCGTEKCSYCGSETIVLLPPAINPDAYGFKVHTPAPLSATELADDLRRKGFPEIAKRIAKTA